VITENGVDVPREDNMSYPEVLDDSFRVDFYKSYLEEVVKAATDDKVGPFLAFSVKRWSCSAVTLLCYGRPLLSACSVWSCFVVILLWYGRHVLSACSVGRVMLVITVVRDLSACGKATFPGTPCKVFVIVIRIQPSSMCAR
jgi:hypothetical protein